MNKLTNFVIGAALGAVVGVAVHYLLGPSDSIDGDSIAGDSVDGTSANQGDGHGSVPYRSRLDAALDAGRQAAIDREAELMASFEQAKRLS